MNNFLNSMAEKAIVGALIGWLVFFIVLSSIFGFPKEDYEWQLSIFLSMAPGVIVGILVAYVASKKKDETSSSNDYHSRHDRDPQPAKTMTEQLLELKNLKDSGIITDEEFNSLKNNILNKESNLW